MAQESVQQQEEIKDELVDMQDDANDTMGGEPDMHSSDMKAAASDDGGASEGAGSDAGAADAEDLEDDLADDGEDDADKDDDDDEDEEEAIEK